MQDFPGTDPVTVLVALTPTAGYGLWPTSKVITTDTLSAANLMTGLEACIDRTNFIGWRLPNYIDGGTQEVLASVTFHNSNHTSGPGIVFDCTVETSGVVSLQGVRNFLATETYVNNGATLHIGNTTYGVGHFVIDATGGGSGSSGTVKGGAQFTVTETGTAILITSNAQLQIDDTGSAGIVGDLALGFTSTTSQVTRYNPEVRSGNRARTELRVHQLTASDFAGGAGDATITASQADVWLLPSGLASGTHVLHIANESTVHEFIIHAPNPSTQGGDVQVKTAATTGVLGTFLADAGAPAENGASARYLNTASGKPRLTGFHDGAGAGYGTPTFTTS